jgi:DNA processing protein
MSAVVPTRRSPDSSLREAVAFSLLPKVGCGKFRSAVEKHGSAAAAFRASTSDMREEALGEADKLLSRSKAASATILLQGEASYPVSLLDLGDPPCFLYALGNTELAGRRCVGIVGTRHSSASGERVAHEMAALLVREGVVVVSGMALGIDAAAHRGALDAGGGTIAVLGGGVDKPYPPTHATLHSRIVGEGLAISEAPPGSNPVIGAFPKRNRIIAALSDTLIVVEAGERSGALITSRLALELGRTVAAVPGPIDSPRHVGSNRLLSEGAAFIARVEDVLSIAGIEAATDSSVPTPRSEAATNENHAAILNAVRAGASDLEDLARSARLSPREFASALSSLELAGLLLVTPTGAVAVSETA